MTLFGRRCAECAATRAMSSSLENDLRNELMTARAKVDALHERISDLERDREFYRGLLDDVTAKAALSPSGPDLSAANMARAAATFDATADEDTSDGQRDPEAPHGLDALRESLIRYQHHQLFETNRVLADPAEVPGVIWFEGDTHPAEPIED